MLILKSFNQFNYYLDFSSGKEVVSNSVLVNKGLYYKENNCISALYINDRILYFSWAADIHLIDNNSFIKLETLKKIDDNSVKKQIQLYQDKKLSLSFYYTAFFGYSFMNPFDNWNDTDEDWDWGLFVANRINNKKNKIEFIDSLSK
ncbi:MAG: hypothetical protein LBV43_04830 [Prevotella sp.]|jgi:hypothetical protein|nr:hypothetical protein [Prevotella sp.]